MPSFRVIVMLATALALPAVPSLAEEDAPATAPAAPPGVTIQQTPVGPVFADSKGMTAYVFSKDTVAGASACEGNCAKAWPPVPAPEDAKPPEGWTVIEREDGGRQWAYKGKPLYTFAHWDVKPGDIVGDNVGGLWRVARP